MMRWWWLPLSLSFVPAAAFAGPDAGGTLVVHDANLLLSATDGSVSICGQGFVPDSCGAIDAELDSSDVNTPKIWVVYAAFPDSFSPRLMGVSWGIHYQPDSLAILLSGKCGDFELNGDGWPGPDTGSTVTWNSAQTNLLVPVYWFSGYQYTAAATSFDLRDHPSQGGNFGDDTVPAVLDSIVTYGRLGFGAVGVAPCPHSGGPNGPDFPDGPNSPDYPVEEGDTRFVWALHLGESVAQVPVNRFTDPTYRKSFPLQTIMVRRAQWVSRDSIETGPVRFWVDSITLPIDPNGTVPDSALDFSSKRLGSRLLTREALYATPRNELRLRALQLRPQDILSWRFAPDSSIALLILPAKTVLLNERDPGTPPTTLPFAVVTSAFSRDGSRVAVATKDGRLLVVDRNGMTLREIRESAQHYEQLHFDKVGQTLIYDREVGGLRATAVLDVRTGLTKTLTEVPSGERYYSDDGTHMFLLVRSAPPAEGAYYDTIDPAAPQLLAEYSVSSGIETVAVCDDGTRVAIEQLEDNDLRLHRVVLLDAALQPIGDPLVTEWAPIGLQFEGKFLFIGTQAHPIPTYVQSVSTTDVLLFDLSF